MAYYDFMTKPFAICIEAGVTSIDEVFPDDLKQKVTVFLANKGLGPDGKPLPKKPEKPEEEVEEPKDESEDPVEEVEEPIEEVEEPVEEPQEPVEEDEEEEPSKDTKEEDKSSVEEDKGAK